MDDETAKYARSIIRQARHDLASAIQLASETIMLERENYSNDARLAWDLRLEEVMRGNFPAAAAFEDTATALEAKADALIDVHQKVCSAFAQL